MNGCITVREYGQLRIGERADASAGCIGERHAAALEALTSRYRTQVFKRTGKATLCATQFVGVVQVHGQLIEVLPKIDGLDGDGPLRRNLVRMLARTRNLEVREGEVAALALHHDLLEVVIRLFTRRLFEEVRRGLAHQYEAREENITVLRGHLHAARQVCINAAHPERFHCRFDEFHVDHPLNQALRAAVVRLRGISRSLDNQRALTELQFALDQVSAVPPDSLAWDRIHLDRTNRRFHSLVGLAKLFLRGSAQDVTHGRDEGFSLLFDMNKLFEEYVGRCAIDAFSDTDLSIRLQGPTRYLLRDAYTGKGAFLAQPDIVASRDRVPVWIVDTKWKQLDRGETYCGVAQSDIYQMLGYASRYAVEDVVLLYPHVAKLGAPGELAAYEVIPPVTVPHTGNVDSRIRICTLTLAKLEDVPGQLRRLLGTVSEVKSLPAAETAA